MKCYINNSQCQVVSLISSTTGLTGADIVGTGLCFPSIAVVFVSEVEPGYAQQDWAGVKQRHRVTRSVVTELLCRRPAGLQAEREQGSHITVGLKNTACVFVVVLIRFTKKQDFCQLQSKKAAGCHVKKHHTIKNQWKHSFPV